MELVASPATASTIMRTAVAEKASKVMDVRMKVPAFSGQDSDWEEYRFKMKMMMAVLGMEAIVKEVESLSLAEILRREQEPQVREQSVFLYTLLVENCGGKASAVIRLDGNNSGFCSWARLCQEFAPQTAYRYTGLLTRLLSPKWSSDRSFITQLLGWERDVLEYEQQTNSTSPGNIRCAVIAKAAPAQVRQYLRFSPEDHTQDYQRLKDVLINFYKKGMIYQDTDVNLAALQSS